MHIGQYIYRVAKATVKYRHELVLKTVINAEVFIKFDYKMSKRMYNKSVLSFICVTDLVTSSLAVF